MCSRCGRLAGACALPTAGALYVAHCARHQSARSGLQQRKAIHSAWGCTGLGWGRAARACWMREAPCLDRAVGNTVQAFAKRPRMAPSGCLQFTALKVHLKRKGEAATSERRPEGFSCSEGPGRT